MDFGANSIWRKCTAAHVIHNALGTFYLLAAELRTVEYSTGDPCSITSTPCASVAPPLSAGIACRTPDQPEARKPRARAPGVAATRDKQKAKINKARAELSSYCKNSSYDAGAETDTTLQDREEWKNAISHLYLIGVQSMNRACKS